MTERERLIELLKKAPLCNRDFDLQYSDATIAKIADYLIANGVIVPPCKVGDKVYVISQGQGFNMRWDVYGGEVTDIHLNRHNELTVRVENGYKFFGYYEPCFIHKTEQEAEKALKEREGI